MKRKQNKRISITTMILPFFQHIVYIEQSRLDRMVQCRWFASLKDMNEAYK